MSRVANTWTPCPVHSSQNLTDGPSFECWLSAPENPCYRARNGITHDHHLWRNGIEVQYDVRCRGFASPTA